MNRDIELQKTFKNIEAKRQLKLKSGPVNAGIPELDMRKLKNKNSASNQSKPTKG